MEPVVLHAKQRQFVDGIAALVNLTLSFWPTKSGKTTARKVLAQRIIDDDDKV